VKISSALAATGLPPVNIHTYYFPAGNNTLVLGKGKSLILGFINGNIEIKPHSAYMENGRE